MALKPKEMIEFYEKVYNMAEQTIQIGRSKKNFLTLCDGYNEKFQKRLMQGLISWRMGFGGVKQYLHEAIEIANEALSELKDYSDNDSKIVENFYLEFAIVVGSLLEKEVAMLDYREAELSKDRKANFEIINALISNRYSIKEDFLEELKFQKRKKLAFETYSNYFNLIKEENLDNIKKLIKECEVLFFKRKKNSFYSGGPAIVGGGPDNDVVVDFVLGAILKYKSYEGESIHKWRW